MTLPVETFLARFLQHVLPRGFHKIRWYGLRSSREHDEGRARDHRSDPRGPTLLGVRGAAAFVSSSALHPHGHPHRDPFPIRSLPMGPLRPCPGLCRPAVLHPVPSDARPQLRTRPADHANILVDRSIRGAVSFPPPSSASLSRVIPLSRPAPFHSKSRSQRLAGSYRRIAFNTRFLPRLRARIFTSF